MVLEFSGGVRPSEQLGGDGSIACAPSSIWEATDIPDGGWAYFPSALKHRATIDGDFLRACSRWGEPVPSHPRGSLIDVLQPVEQAAAVRNTLSSRYGIGAFPFHSDTAHWVLPCRYVCLACVEPGPSHRATALISLRPILGSTAWHQATSQGVFLVRNGKSSFYSTVSAAGRPFVRYDPGCMEPLSPEAKQTFAYCSHLIETADPDLIQWNAGDMVVLDNWSTLHARDASPAPDDSRRLLRLLLR